ncbi:MAG: hypothetical protein Q8P25_04460 [Candidatus Curtissbacteria bacterium]|nr:hypothetical protein [Candidatus Curtissbacteria bacterium]
MSLTYTEHLKTRLRQRGLPLKLVKKVFDKNEESYFDNLRHHYIVVSSVLYKGRCRKVLAAYDKIGTDSIEVITIHPITDEQIKQGLNSGRWSYEKNKN